jgi:hypothetical protein
MAVDTQSLFAQVIQDHLELKQRNSEIEGDLPLERYKHEDPFENHPLFKTEEQARIEETMETIEGDAEAVSAHAPLAWPTEEEPEPSEEGLWSRSRDFDWGD